MNYRRIYEENYGPIPTDDEGRTYDIHHKDGNRKNNDPSNLVALSIEEHYKVHYSQGDYAAAMRIIARKSVTPELLSELSSKCQRRLVQNGTHNFLGGESHKQWSRKNNLKRVADGTHHFLNAEAASKRMKKRTEEGKNPLQNPQEVTCPHCGTKAKGGVMYRWHFNNCRHKTKELTNVRD